MTGHQPSRLLPLRGGRRELLIAGGALIVAIPLFGTPSEAAAENTAAKPVSRDEVDSFLAIAANGDVTVYSGKVDLGTGVATALTQIVAEELDVPLARVSIIQGDTLLTPDQGPTYGSLSIQIGGMQLRQAAATARQALLKAAAEKLGVPPAGLRVVDGVIAAPDGRRISYAELIGGRTFSLKVDPHAQTKDPGEFRVVGTAVPRRDIPAKVTGRFTYMQDFRLSGMLHGRVVRPPAIGAELREVDVSSVAGIPGFVKVVREGNFLGVVAETEWAAIKAMRALRAVWSPWQGLPEQARLWEYVRNTRVVKQENTSDIGDAPAALAKAPRKLSATYDFAIHTHGSIGPSCAVAAFQDGKLTCWSASQATHNLRKQLAAMLGMAEADVRCIYVDGAGCYGRNGHEDAAADAALLARAVGAPVRVQWMRADEHGWDPKGPPTLIDLAAGLDENGQVLAWYSQFYLPQGAAGNVPLVAAILAGLPHETVPAPGNIIKNSDIPYTFPNVRTRIHRLETTPFRPSWIRTPGRMQNTFANEAFLDELAAAAGADPLEFRLRHLNDPRGMELLQRLARLAKWEKRTTPRQPSGEIATGRGLSYVKYELARTYVGAVADVEVNRRSGEIRVRRFYIAHDCGQIINPDGLRNQIEGNVLMTVSRTLKEQVTFDRAHVTSLDWISYPILTFPEIPEVEIALIDRPREKPWGAGEPTAAVIPAAIANAVFDAVGVRLRSVPFTPAKVLQAIQGA
jgi:nicotinate dehydrogenase subunit B